MMQARTILSRNPLYHCKLQALSIHSKYKHISFSSWKIKLPYEINSKIKYNKKYIKTSEIFFYL